MQSRTLEKMKNGHYLLFTSIDGRKKEALCPFSHDKVCCGTWCALFRVTQDGYMLRCAGSPSEEYAMYGGDE